MSANLQLLLDSVEQGMLIVSPAGVVRFANQAAHDCLPLVLGQVLKLDGLKNQILSVARGYVRLPFVFEMDAPSGARRGDSLRVKILESPLGGGYLMVLSNISEATRYQHVVANFANLMDAATQNGMTHFATELRQLLHRLEPDFSTRLELDEELKALFQQGEQLAAQCAQLALFAQTFSKSPALASERIQVVDLLTRVLARLKPLLDKRNIKCFMGGMNQEFPVIYGSRDWLVEALYGCVDYLVQHAQVRSDLEFQVRPYGHFVSVQIRNHGRGMVRQGQQGFQPFVLSKHSGQEADMPLLGLSLALCKQVVHLHHGTLRLSDGEESEDLQGMIIELPAGAPAEAISPQLDAEQAQRYAQDLMRLMRRS